MNAGMPQRPLADALSALPEDAVEVGRVLGAWGVRGGIKVKPFAASPQALFSAKHWHLLPAEEAVPRPAAGGAQRPPALLSVVSAREQGDTVVATVQGLDDRDAAQALAGARVFVSRASFPTPGSGEFYWVDLIGLGVRNREGQDLGTVMGLIDTGPHCVLRVASADAAAEERLIPFVDAYVDAVDLPARQIRVDWGLDF